MPAKFSARFARLGSPIASHGVANRVAIFFDSRIVGFSFDMQVKIVDPHGLISICDEERVNRVSEKVWIWSRSERNKPLIINRVERWPSG